MSAIYDRMECTFRATADDVSLYKLSHPIRPAFIEAISFIPDAAATANDTNYATFSVEVGGSVVGSFTTQTSGSGGSGNLVAGTAITVSISGSGDLSADTAVVFKKVDSGTGVTAGGTFSLKLRFDRLGAG